jgi:phosphate transport system substrate-binding protein
MKLNRRAIFGGITAGTLALGLAACGGGGNDEEGGSGDLATGEINASGASFPDAYYAAAIEAYAEVNPDLMVTYNATGSGTGKSEFGEGLNDFAGTDSLVKDDDGVEAGSFQYIPTVAAPITISYNLPGVDALQLPQDVLAGIFAGTITTWNDATIAEANPDATLPDTAITLAVRSDGSGTTTNFSKFLEAASPEVWTLGSGDTIEWPGNAVAAEKNTGVAQVIQDTEGSIGYVDLADAIESSLVTASIENADGAFIAPTLEGATAALDGATVEEDLSYNPLNAAGAEAYPITAPTYILIRTEYEDPNVAAGVKEFVNYLLTDGQALAAENNYAALPTSLQEQALEALNSTIAD